MVHFLSLTYPFRLFYITNVYTNIVFIHLFRVLDIFWTLLLDITGFVIRMQMLIYVSCYAVSHPHKHFLQKFLDTRHPVVYFVRIFFILLWCRSRDPSLILWEVKSRILNF